MFKRATLFLLAVMVVIMVLTPALPTCGGEPSEKKSHAAKKQKLVPLPIALPKQIVIGTPEKAPPNVKMRKEKYPRDPFNAPEGSKVLSRDKAVTASDEDPITGDIEQVTDGDKEGEDGSYIEFGPNLQHVQVDLEKNCVIHAVIVWHYHKEPRVYHDVIVQVADDPDFINNVRTLFNNDFDNSAGLGVGKDWEYYDTFEGRLIKGKSEKARYVRCYSKGNTSDDMNHMVEIEVWGAPVKK